MFSIDQIKTAHSKVKSGADFPTYIQELIQLGVAGYDTYVSDGHTQFAGNKNFKIESSAKYPTMHIAGKSDSVKFQKYLKNHQQGQTDYLTFCRQSAETGVEKWTVDMKEMSCTYYDTDGNKMLVEQIPGV